MRFSAVQEDGYGVGLGQETLPTDVDESMMAATGGVEPGGGNQIEEGSMISNLPLLFANGYPTSLEKITLPELERFVTFMVQCSLGHDTAEEIRQPQWWPKEIKFSIPLVRPKKINDSYTSNLKKLVFRCYTYHRSEYLLRFCSYLAQYPHDKLEYVNNWDSTTSLYLKTTGKLLVTFRNENMNYDRKIEGSRRMLLQSSKPKTDYQNGTKCLRRRSVQKQAPSPAMVEPAIEDIYLCDNCDAEFIGLNKMKEHEKLCYRVEPRPLTPDVEEVPEIKQDQFMDYFKLKSTTPSESNGASRPLTFSDSSLQNRTSGRIRGSVNLTRCPTIPFSSPAGLALAKKSKMMTEITQQERLERIERHLTAPALTSSYMKPKWLSKVYEFDRWSVTFKPNRDKTTKPDEYVHTYNFGDYSGKLKLDLKSQLLYIACKPIYVAVKRLTDEELEELKHNPSRYKTPEREVPSVRQRLLSIESIDESTPGDELNPIVIDLDDEDEPAPAPAPQVIIEPHAIFEPQVIIEPRPLICPTPMSVSQRPQRFSWNLNSVVGMTNVSPVQPNNHLVTRTNARPPGPKRSKSLPSAKPVIYVDLCSSDDEPMEVEEVDSNTCTSADENRDPMQKRASATDEVCVDSVFIRNSLLGPSKLCTKPCIYPADSTSGWLSNLSVDGEPRRDSFLSRGVSVLKGKP